MNFNQKAEELEMKIISADGLEERIDHMIELSHVLLYKTGGVQQSLKFSLEALRLSRETNYEKGLAWSSYEIGRAYSTQSDQPNTLNYLNSALEQFIRLNDLGGIALTYKSLGNLYKMLNMDDQAFEFYSKGLEAARQSGNKTDQSGILANLGGLMTVMKRPRDGIRYLLESISIEESLPCRSPGSAVSYVNLAELYKEAGDLEKAYHYADRSVSVADQMEEPVCKAYGLTALANLCRETGDPDKAMEYFLRGLEVVERSNMKYDKLSILTGLHEVFTCKGDTSKALEYLKAAEALAREIGASHRLHKILLQIADIYEKLFDYPNARFYREEASRLDRELKEKS